MPFIYLRRIYNQIIIIFCTMMIQTYGFQSLGFFQVINLRVGFIMLLMLVFLLGLGVVYLYKSSKLKGKLVVGSFIFLLASVIYLFNLGPFSSSKLNSSYDSFYDYIFLNERLYDTELLSKIWIHRVNHPKKLEELIDLNKNSEIDVVIKESKTGFQLLVGHEVDAEDNIPLASFLKRVKGHHNIKMWLDLKNVTPNNKDLFLNAFTSLMEENALTKSQFIMESTSLEVAKFFMDKGYLASFYIWIPDIKNKSEEQKEELLKELTPAIKASHITRLSFDYALIPAASKVYTSELPDVKFLSWDTSKRIDRDLDYSVNQVSNPQIDVFLVKYKTEYDR